MTSRFNASSSEDASPRWSMSESRNMLHAPVLLQEVIAYLDPQPGDFMIDGTVDGGGHASEIAKRIFPGGTLFGTDADGSLLERARENIMTAAGNLSGLDKNIFLVRGNYADLPAELAERKLPKADGLLIDLGFSSEQLEASGRGFSFKKNEPLLMTYDAEREPLRELLKSMNEDELARIIREYGGERMAHRIAREIRIGVERNRMQTTQDLASAARNALPRNYERGRIDPATRTFQALRIYANDELGQLAVILANLSNIVKSGGRAVIVSFHSLEDRMVKNAFREGVKRGEWTILTKKPVVPSREEASRNPRSRSAKLRAIQLL